MMERRAFLLGSLGVPAGMTLAGQASAQPAAFPTVPVRVILPFAAGGTGDVLARILGEKAGAELGQPMIIENRSGANGLIAAQFVARARPDGYTLLRMSSGHVILPAMQAVPYDWEHDFVPVFGVLAAPLLFAVNAASPIRSLDDLAAHARSRPGGVDYASGGAGSVSHLATASLARRLGINATHVPYRGYSAAVEALRGGQVQLICATPADVGELARAGMVRVLAIATAERQPRLPDVPTMTELGFEGFVAASWNAYLAPAGTPGPVVSVLHDALTKASRDDGVRGRMEALGILVMPMTLSELAQFLRDEARRWRSVVEENGVRLEG